MNMEEIIKKIEAWFEGPRNYQEGCELLNSIPGQHLNFLQLTWFDTYESRIRLYKYLNNVMEESKK